MRDQIVTIDSLRTKMNFQCKFEVQKYSLPFIYLEMVVTCIIFSLLHFILCDGCFIIMIVIRSTSFGNFDGIWFLTKIEKSMFIIYLSICLNEMAHFVNFSLEFCHGKILLRYLTSVSFDSNEIFTPFLLTLFHPIWQKLDSSCKWDLGYTLYQSEESNIFDIGDIICNLYQKIAMDFGAFIQAPIWGSTELIKNLDIVGQVKEWCLGRTWTVC